MATVLGTEATRQQSVNYGCIVEDKSTNAILHFVEKPSSYISTIINCGVYIFSLEVFQMLQVGLILFKASKTLNLIQPLTACVQFQTSRVLFKFR